MGPRSCRHRELRQHGNKQLWDIIGFSGTWDPAEFERALNSEGAGASQPTDATNDNYLTIKALEARARLRLASKYARLPRRKGPDALDRAQKDLVRRLEDGSLRRAANDATIARGNRRLRARDGNIGGNATHSQSARFLGNYSPPMDWN